MRTVIRNPNTLGNKLGDHSGAWRRWLRRKGLGFREGIGVWENADQQFHWLQLGEGTTLQWVSGVSSPSLNCHEPGVSVPGQWIWSSRRIQTCVYGESWVSWIWFTLRMAAGGMHGRGVEGQRTVQCSSCWHSLGPHAPQFNGCPWKPRGLPQWFEHCLVNWRAGI